MSNESGGFNVPWGRIAEIGFDLGLKLVKAGIAYFSTDDETERAAIVAQSDADTAQAKVDMFSLHKLQDGQNAKHDAVNAGKPDRPDAPQPVPLSNNDTGQP